MADFFLNLWQLMAGKKRGSRDIGETLDLEPKRVKYRDLESVFRAEGNFVSCYKILLWYVYGFFSWYRG